MDLAQLAALAAVVDEGSFDAAATSRCTSRRRRSASASRRWSSPPVRCWCAGRSRRPSRRRARPYLRLARQVDALVRDAAAETGAGGRGPVTVPIAVNADSMATWVLPALATVAAGHLLRPAPRRPVAHRRPAARRAPSWRRSPRSTSRCRAAAPTRLGTTRYRPMATPGVRRAVVRRRGDASTRSRSRRWSCSTARTTCRSATCGARTPAPARPAAPLRPRVGRLRRGRARWGSAGAMLPARAVGRAGAPGRLVELDPGRHVDVVLHWQQWTLRTPALERVAAAIRTAAADHLL